MKVKKVEKETQDYIQVFYLNNSGADFEPYIIGGKKKKPGEINITKNSVPE